MGSPVVCMVAASQARPWERTHESVIYRERLPLSCMVATTAKRSQVIKRAIQTLLSCEGALVRHVMRHVVRLGRRTPFTRATCKHITSCGAPGARPLLLQRAWAAARWKRAKHVPVRCRWTGTTCRRATRRRGCSLRAPPSPA